MEINPNKNVVTGGERSGQRSERSEQEKGWRPFGMQQRENRGVDLDMRGAEVVYKAKQHCSRFSVSLP